MIIKVKKKVYISLWQYRQYFEWTDWETIIVFYLVSIFALKIKQKDVCFVLFLIFCFLWVFCLFLFVIVCSLKKTKVHIYKLEGIQYTCNTAKQSVIYEATFLWTLGPRRFVTVNKLFSSDIFISSLQT